MENSSKSNFRNLLDDDNFIRWVLHPTPELNLFWEKRMDEQEELKNDIHTLKNILHNLRIEEPELSATEKDEIWQKIESRIDDSSGKKKYRKILLWGSSVAATVVIAVAGLLLLRAGDAYRDIDYNQYALADSTLLKSGNINLILSENKRIDIEKDSTVIRYDSQGGVKINSEKIEEPVAKKETPELNQLIVPYGKTTSLVLSDGTKVWVNSGSRIIYPAIFDKNRREIFISGEVFLDVAKNDKVPFLIKTNDIELNVLGTKFNVSAYSDDSVQSVVLVSGSVEVKSRNLRGGYKIEPNQMVSYSTTTNDVNIQQVDVSYYITWVNGYLLFKNEKLDVVFQKVARHFNVEFSYDRSKFQHTTVTGKLDMTRSLNEVLDIISTTAPIKYQIQDNKVLVESR